MKYIHGTEDFTLDKDSAVTLGKFDGVHMGHQKLISIVEEKETKKVARRIYDAFIIYFYHRKRLMLLFVEKSDIITVRKGVF